MYANQKTALGDSRGSLDLQRSFDDASASTPVEAGMSDSDTTIDDRAQIQRALEFIHPGGGLVELLLVGVRTKDWSTPHVEVGVFDSAEAIEAEAERASGHCSRVLMTVNPVAANRTRSPKNTLGIARKGRCTGEGDVKRRQWLVVEVVHRGLTADSATDVELETAAESAHAICMELRAAGWPQPIEIRTATGIVLLYRIDLPADDGGLCRRVLEAIRAKISASMVDVSLRGAQAAHKIPMPGTQVRVGGHLPDRPHRMVSIETAPDVVEVVSRDSLEALAIAIPTSSQKTTASTPVGGMFSSHIGADLSADVRDHLSESPALTRLFNGKGKQSGDVSDRGYDWSLAMELVRAGVRNPNELVTAIWNRPVYAQNKPDMAYVTATAHRALEAGLQREREATKGKKTGGVDVEKVVRYDSDPPVWVFSVAGKEVVLCSADLIRRPTLLCKFTDALGHVPELPDKEEFLPWVNSLLARTEVVDQPGDASPDEGIRQELLSIVTGMPEGEEAADLDRDQVIMRDGRRHFKLRSVVRKLDETRHQGITEHKAAMHLRQLGAEPVQLRIGAEAGLRLWALTIAPTSPEPEAGTPPLPDPTPRQESTPDEDADVLL